VLGHKISHLGSQKITPAVLLITNSIAEGLGMVTGANHRCQFGILFKANYGSTYYE
jgi:hypothetical protein